MRHVYNKLVRNKVPELMQANGEVVTTRVASESEISRYLLAKLLEEVSEFVLELAPDKLKADSVIEELADIIEVCYALARECKCSVDSLNAVVLQKLREKGSYIDRIILLEAQDPK